MELRSTVNRRRSQIARTKSFPCIHTQAIPSCSHFYRKTAKTPASVKIGVTQDDPKLFYYRKSNQIIEVSVTFPVSSFIQVSSIRNQSSLLLKIPNSLKAPSEPCTMCGGLGVECVLYFITRTQCARSFSQKGLVERRNISRVQN